MDARSARAAVAAGAVTLALAACGGHPATRRDVIARGNAICFAALQSIRAVPAPAGGLTASPAAATYAAKVQPILGREASQLRALPRPRLERATLDRFIAAAGAETSDYRRLAAAARRGDPAGVEAALAALRANPAARYARAYGLSQCTGAGGSGG